MRVLSTWVNDLESGAISPAAQQRLYSELASAKVDQPVRILPGQQPTCFLISHKHIGKRIHIHIHTSYVTVHARVPHTVYVYKHLHVVDDLTVARRE